LLKSGNKGCEGEQTEKNKSSRGEISSREIKVRGEDDSA